MTVDAPAVRTTCAYCGVGCGVLAKPVGDRTATIAGDPEHPANFGKLCSKGTHLGETIGLEGRLLHPMIGQDRAGWDETLDLVAERFADSIREHGPDSVAFYVSGQLLTEDYYVANKLMKGFIGSGNIDTNSRLCMASAVAAHNRAFGEDLVPACYDDLDEADLIVLVGSNTAWCHPVIWQRIEAARVRRRTKLVVIDPRRTETADGADLHLPLRTNSDIALFTGLQKYLLDHRAIDRSKAERRLNIPADYWSSLDGITVDQVARTCDLDPADLSKFYHLFAATPRTVTLFSQGVNQSTHGTDKANAIINVHLATGRIGKRGAAPFSITGQPNAMGGREVGGLASALAAHMDFAPENVDRAGRFWGGPRTACKPGLKAVDLFNAIGEGKIKALWVMATNPAVSMPDAGRVRDALAACPFVVVSDVIGATDTSRFAHVRLPALAWGEKDGTVTNSERQVSRQRPFLAPPGEARADWAIVADVARRMGFDDHFKWQNPAAVFREYCAMTAFENGGARKLDLGAWVEITDAAYDDMKPFQWGGRRISFAPGKARLVTVLQPALTAAPMVLNTGRYRDQWHTMTRTGLSPRLSQHRREPLVEVHPADAEVAGLADGDLAWVQTGQGQSAFKVGVSKRQRQGEIFVPIHWTDHNASGGRAGLLPDRAVDPFSGQPGFKCTPAALEKIAPEWRAFLVARDPAVGQPDALWWVKVKVAGGWLIELAGDGDTAAIERLLPPGDRLEAGNRMRGMRRIAITREGRLEAALFIIGDGRLPGREWLIAQLSEDEPANALALLAGRASGQGANCEPALCVCLNVGSSRIAAAIEAGCTTVGEIGTATGAGTNCGSCRPAIGAMIAQRKLANAA
ncbi:MAG: molybdopterin-dependent oxidoreductase [Sphingomicrobium sp.]